MPDTVCNLNQEANKKQNALQLYVIASMEGNQSDILDPLVQIRKGDKYILTNNHGPSLANKSRYLNLQTTTQN